MKANLGYIVRYYIKQRQGRSELEASYRARSRTVRATLSRSPVSRNPVSTPPKSTDQINIKLKTTSDADFLHLAMANISVTI